MGQRKDWDANAIQHWLWLMSSEIRSPYNDGYTASAYKKEMYDIKCLIEDLYSRLPEFAGEEEWHKQRELDILSRK